MLHDAVTVSEVAEMGPILPLLSNLADDERRQVQQAAKVLLASEADLPVT
ncbi:MAG: hypothetical protein R6W77_13070 [Trueperaceae bacterium]